MEDRDVWIRKINNRLAAMNERGLKLVYHFIVAMEQREARLKK